MGLSTLALPSIVRAASATTLKFVPQIDLAFLDPHWTIANVTRGHGYIVFDTLYGQDGTFTPQRQMLQGHVVEKDGKLWKLTLRPGLVWHDRTPRPCPRLCRQHPPLGCPRRLWRCADGRDR